MNLFDVLEVQLVGPAHELELMPNVFIDVVFYLRGRERYRFDAGSTDYRGHLTVSYDFFESTRKDNQAFALMDYNTDLNECDPVILLCVPTVSDLQLRLDGLTKWFPDKAVLISERFGSANNVRVNVSEVRITVGNGVSPLQVNLIIQS